MARKQRIDAAIDRLAGLYDSGHLLAASIPENLLGGACDEIEAARAFLAAFDEWAQSPDLCGGERFDAMLDARNGVDERATLTPAAAAAETEATR